MGTDRPETSALATSAGYAGGAFADALLLNVLGFGLAGGGHGVMWFWGLALWGLLFWPIAAAAVAWTHRPTGLLVFLATMSFQYGFTGLLVSGSHEGDRFRHTWNVAAWGILAYGATYCAGQALLWWAFATRIRKTRVQFTVGRMMIAVAVFAAVLSALVTIDRYWSEPGTADAIVIPARDGVAEEG